LNFLEKGVKMKPFLIEEYFINFLTKIAWWINIRFNKETVWLSLFYIIFSSTLISVLQTIDSLTNAQDFIVLFFNFLFKTTIQIIFLLLFWWAAVLFNDIFNIGCSVLRNTKITPNPNKNTWWIVECRYTAVVPLILNLLNEASFSKMISIILIIVPSFYILCVDQIPPGIKKKKLEIFKNKKSF
jgi:hypothetical protein